ncbi:MAG: SDR family NAD(P)-dependent oxidoreductase [Phycisphaerales bacterium]|nr:SDR family NAD(P)-dependent oxidoreductase [Phycisphaerales bacterium]
MSNDLRGRPIAITGASSGIGEATALACAAAGMPVALAARRLDRLEEVAGRIRAAGGRATVCQLDVADAQACAEFVERAAVDHRGLFGVFANAGYGAEQPVHLMPPGELRRMFEVNLFGSLNIVLPAVARLLKNDGPRRGHILWCSSCLALMPVPRGGAYSASKAAQHHLARAMRIELADKGVEVSSVHPIGTRTEFSQAMLASSGRAERTRKSPDWIMQPPSRVADAVVACLRRPKAEVWPGFRAHCVRTVMCALAAWPALGDAVRRRSFVGRADTP